MAGVAIAIMAGIVAFAVVRDGSADNAGLAQTTSSQSTASSKGENGRHHRRGASRPGGHHRHRARLDLLSIVKAQMEPSAEALVSEELMPKVTNGWTVQDHYQTTTIAAGGAPRPTDGMFAIYRARVRPFSITTDLVKVPGSGTVTITKAPLGRKVATSAQKRGEFEFKGESGVTGTLHLADDTVTLNP
jgi:hypothetical protein